MKILLFEETMLEPKTMLIDKNQKTYHVQEILNKATEAQTVSIYITVWIHVVLKILSTQAATNRAHNVSF